MSTCALTPGLSNYCDLQPGVEPVAGYRLVRLLGVGSFGQVWEAEGPGGIRLALKFIRLDDAEATAAEMRALRLLLAKNLRHANVLTMQGAWRGNGYLILATELAEGTLMDRLEACKESGLPG